MPQEAGARAPWVLEEYEHVALVLHLLQAPVPFGVDDLDNLDRVFITCAAQRAEAHLAKGTLTQLVLDVKVARFQDPLAGLGGGSGWKFGSRARGSVRHVARLTAVNARFGVRPGWNHGTLRRPEFMRVVSAK